MIRLTPTRAAASAVALAAALAPNLAHAVISGGVDPETSASTFGTWMLATAGGIIWTLIFMWRGIALGLAGRSAGGPLALAAAGAVVFFGAAYWLTKAGI